MERVERKDHWRVGRSLTGGNRREERHILDVQSAVSQGTEA